MKKFEKNHINEMMGRIDPSYKKFINERFFTKQDLMEFTNDGDRPLHQIAQEIYQDWGSKINYAAKPYLDAMMSLDTVEDNYGFDSGRMIVAYFLSNAGTWKGEKAKEIKKELKKMIGLKEGLKVEKEVDENENVDEIFGSSKRKQQKEKEEKIEKSKQEIQKYDFRRLGYQPSQKGGMDEINQMKRNRLEDAKRAMPTVAELMPILFDPNQGSANASIISGGKTVTILVPANWFFIRKDGYIEDEKAKKELLSRIDTEDHLVEQGVDESENIESFYKDVDEKTQQMLKYPENLKEKISKQDIESLIEDGDYTTILTIYDFLFDPPEQKIAEHHSPEHKQKVEKLKGKLDFLFQNDHYDIIDKLCQMVDQLYSNKMPEPELTESKNKPNDPALWSRAKAAAKKKFDVYPSAYANAWASKWYKEKGGTWRKSKK